MLKLRSRAWTSCQLISDSEQVTDVKGQSQPNLNSKCPEDTIGDFCVPCLWMSITCYFLKVCKERKCVCSAGYSGSDCLQGNNKHYNNISPILISVNDFSLFNRDLRSWVSKTMCKLQLCLWQCERNVSIWMFWKLLWWKMRYTYVKIKCTGIKINNLLSLSI